MTRHYSNKAKAILLVAMQTSIVERQPHRRVGAWPRRGMCLCEETRQRTCARHTLPVLVTLHQIDNSQQRSRDGIAGHNDMSLRLCPSRRINVFASGSSWSSRSRLQFRPRKIFRSAVRNILLTLPTSQRPPGDRKDQPDATSHVHCRSPRISAQLPEFRSNRLLPRHRH